MVAVVDLCSRFLPGMVERGRGAVLNVASTAAFQPLPGQAAYGAAKAFVLSYTRSLSAELKGTGVIGRPCSARGRWTPASARRPASRQGGAEDALPPFMWVPAAEVAQAAVEGMDKGTLVVIPGPPTRSARRSPTSPRSACSLPILAKSHPGLR